MLTQLYETHYCTLIEMLFGILGTQSILLMRVTGEIILDIETRKI
jgi:hypothetical protein